MKGAFFEVTYSNPIITLWDPPPLALLIQTIFGAVINPTALAKLKKAEKIRDRLLHGKNNVEGKDQRHAISDLFEYFEEFDTQTTKLLFGFSPFGSLKGLTGRKEKLEKSTTRWVLKGMGFPVS